MGGDSSCCRHIMYEEEKKIQERYQDIIVFLLLFATLPIGLSLFKSFVPIFKAEAMKDHYDKIIREQNERHDQDKTEQGRREEQARQNWEAMKVEWQKEKDVMRREAEARIERDQEAFDRLQEEKKMMAEELRNAKKEYEAKMEEIEERKGSGWEGRGGDNMEAVEEEMGATGEQREGLQRWMEKSQGEEEEGKKRGAEREAQQEEVNRKRDEKIRIAREELEKKSEACKRPRKREKAEDDLKQGIPPEMKPTEEDIRRVKAKLQYSDDHFHFAVCGQAGSGKSFLINALRGMKNNTPMSAKTGAVEAAQSIGIYPDMHKRPPRAWIVWYDIPSAGTPNISDWQYFNDQGLFIFDLIILTVGDRISITDIWIIKNCRRFDVPCLIVRSKSDLHIKNAAMDELGYDSDEDQDHKVIVEQARRTFIKKAQQNFATILAKEKLPLQRMYIISAPVMFSYINGRSGKSEAMIDEGYLIEDLYQAAKSTSYGSCPEL